MFIPGAASDDDPSPPARAFRLDVNDLTAVRGVELGTGLELDLDGSEIRDGSVVRDLLPRTVRGRAYERAAAEEELARAEEAVVNA